MAEWLEDIRLGAGGAILLICIVGVVANIHDSAVAGWLGFALTITSIRYLKAKGRWT